MSAMNACPLDSPVRDYSLFDKPPQLSLGQNSVLEVEATVFVHVGLPDAQSLAEPRVLRVSVMVLCSPQGMGHALQAVHDGTGKVIDGIDPVWRDGEGRGGGGGGERMWKEYIGKQNKQTFFLPLAHMMRLQF